MSKNPERDGFVTVTIPDPNQRMENTYRVTRRLPDIPIINDTLSVGVARQKVTAERRREVYTY